MFLVLDHGVAYFYTESAEKKYRDLFHPSEIADLVILGTSHSEAGINPRYLEGGGIRVYNFSFSGANPVFYHQWFKDIFRMYYPKPKIMLFAVDWFLFDDEILRRKFEHDSEYFPLEALIQSALNPELSLKRLFQNRFSTFKSHISTVNLFLSKQTVDGYYKGYYPYYIRTTDQPVHRPNSNRQINAFFDLLDLIQEDGIKIIFVQMPEYAPETQINRNNIQFLHEIANQRDIPFLDYNQDRISAINHETSYFLDWGHLNTLGSRMFSQLLKDDLKEILDL